jgi:transposase InsO family protein
MTAGVTKQAVHKFNKRSSLFEERLYCLSIELDQLRDEHPGCGLDKAYSTLRPDWIGRDRFIREFTRLGYQTKRKKNYKRTTIPGYIKYPNLIEGMIVYDFNMIWQSDITYFPIGSYFCYIVFITDLFSRRILGYQANDHLRAEANISALSMAIRQRDGQIKNLIHHSDKGGQYIDNDYIAMLESHGAHISMGLCAQDNAYAERVNGIIKNEYLDHWDIKNLKELRRSLKRAVNHYNFKRQHRSLKKTCPMEFEKTHQNCAKFESPGEIIFSKNSSLQNQKDVSLVFSGRGMENKAIMCPLSISY